jgi:hypothetical protein
VNTCTIPVVDGYQVLILAVNYSWIKEQDAFLTCILVKNNVVPLILGDYVIAGK